MLMIAAALLLGAGCADSRQESAGAPGGGTPKEQKNGSDRQPAFEVIADRLESPWSIDFAADAIYISERGGAVVRIDDSGASREQLRLKKPVNQNGESGFMGFVLSPSFEGDRSAYAYYSYEENGGTMNRIVRLRRDEGGVWRETASLLEGIPGASYHDGGRLAFGPDGMLYATTGDAGDEELAQNPDSLAGKILRLAPDGSIPADNPNPGSPVYSYGHRNPQGLGWSREGAMYAAEHGPSGRPGGHDELNIIEPGANYGWPAIIGDETKPGMRTPLYHTGDDTLAPSGLAVAEDGTLLVAGLRGERLAAFSADGRPLPDLLTGEGRIRDVRLHGGGIYVLTNNTDGRGAPKEGDDRLLRLTADR